MEISNLYKELVPKVYQLEKNCYPNEFFSTIEINSYITDFSKKGLVVIDEDFLIGYALVLNDEFEMEVRIGIHEQYRRLKHATRLLTQIKSKLHPGKSVLKCWVPETNLEGHLFLQANGFICSKTDSRHYKRRQTGGYMFIYRWEWGLTEKNGLYIPEELALGIEAI